LRVPNQTTTLFLLRVIIKAIFIHANENGLLIPPEDAMKGAPGVFTHIVDSFVLVTIKQLSVKYMLGLMDYQEAKGPEPINWIALFDFDHVDVDRVADLCNVKPKDLWPPMDRLAMKHDFLAQKVSLVEWLYSAPVKVCLRKYPKRIIRFMTY